MTHLVSLELVSAGGLSRHRSAVFEDDEWASFELYLSDTEKLCRCSLVKREYPYNISLALTGKTAITTGEPPPDDEFELFLFRLRKFLLNDEPVFFHRIRNTLGRRVEDEEFRSGLVYLREKFSRHPFAVTATIQGRSIRITSDRMLMSWLNSELFHHDYEKAELLEHVHRMMPEKASRTIFGWFLNEKARAVINLANLVRVVVGEQNDFHLGDLRVGRIKRQ